MFAQWNGVVKRRSKNNEEQLMALINDGAG